MVISYKDATAIRLYLLSVLSIGVWFSGAQERDWNISKGAMWVYFSKGASVWSITFLVRMVSVVIFIQLGGVRLG